MENLIGNPDLGAWYLDDLENALMRSHTLEELNALMAPLAHKSRQRRGTSSDSGRMPAPKTPHSRAQQGSWHYDRGQTGRVVYAEGGWVLPARDAELRERT